MRFLADQDVWASTILFLRGHGHDIVTASDAMLSSASDEDLLRHAKDLKRILITRDRDYGRLVFVKYLGGGVLYLRVTPASTPSVHAQLLHVLESFAESELENAFVVIESNRFRFRKPIE